jgi:hypothetical protein
MELTGPPFVYRIRVFTGAVAANNVDGAEEAIADEIPVPTAPPDKTNEDQIFGEMLVWSLVYFPVLTNAVFILSRIRFWISPVNSVTTNSFDAIDVFPPLIKSFKS